MFSSHGHLSKQSWDVILSFLAKLRGKSVAKAMEACDAEAFLKDQLFAASSQPSSIVLQEARKLATQTRKAGKLSKLSTSAALPCLPERYEHQASQLM